MDDSSPQNQESTEELQLCPSCLAPNDPECDFCTNCQAPLGATAGLDPIKSIWARGYIYREMAHGKASNTVIIGAWLIFGPMVMFTIMALAFAVFSFTFGASRFEEPAGAWLLLGLASATMGIPAAIILYKTTTRSIDKLEEAEATASPDKNADGNNKASL